MLIGIGDVESAYKDPLHAGSLQHILGIFCGKPAAEQKGLSYLCRIFLLPLTFAFGPLHGPQVKGFLMNFRLEPFKDPFTDLKIREGATVGKSFQVSGGIKA